MFFSMQWCVRFRADRRRGVTPGRRVMRWLLTIVVGGLLTACASTGPREGFAATDDYEPFNRQMLKGNLRIDRYVLRPAAQGYDAVTPALIQHLIGNGLSHLRLTADFANYLLQGDVERSLDTLGRFTLNTVLGVGVLDPAREFGLSREPTDFGLTLASHGVGEGSYLVLPLLGPTTMRDAPGFFVDMAFTPTTYIGPLTALDGVGPAITTLRFVDARNHNSELLDDLFYRSDDPYVSVRSIYLQRRRALVARDGNPADTLPDIFDDES